MLIIILIKCVFSQYYEIPNNTNDIDDLCKYEFKNFTYPINYTYPIFGSDYSGFWDNRGDYYYW